MNRQDHDLPLRTLFSEQARVDRQQAPAFDEALRRPSRTPRLAVERLAPVLALLLIMAVAVPLVYRSVASAQRPPSAALPNLLDALDDASIVQWQSPTTFLLDMSNPAEAHRAPSPEQNQPDSRRSNG
jgi:hypothetical protein